MNSDTVLDRLDRLKRIASRHGFQVRAEPLSHSGGSSSGHSGNSGSGSTWCEIRGQRVMFLDISQTAAEQAVAIREILEMTATIRPHQPTQVNKTQIEAPKAA